MKQKKLFSLLLSSLALAGLLSGCSAAPAGTSDESAALAQTDAMYEITEENSVPELTMTNQPEASYWFPAQLLEWNPEEDPDLIFNQSTVPLAKRADRDSLSPVNATQNKDTNIMAVSIMNSSTSGNAPNGLNKADCNTFSYWQYVDTLVYWGGSSGEGLIVPPSPDVTDAGHKNGVKVIGTIFFPQNAHGGKLEWLEEFLQKDASGSFPMIDKLVSVAKLYGFDGWFMNQESEGTDEKPLTGEHAALMQEFLQKFKEAAPELSLIYYDSMTFDGKMDWQNALTDRNLAFLKDQDGKNVSDSMFLNFWWTDEEYASLELLKASRSKAEENGIDPYSLYAGIDIQSEGYLTPIDWSLFEASADSTYTSLGIYCPNWAYTTASNMEDFWQKENALWVNSNGDPSLTSTSSNSGLFKGISAYAVERTAITSLPFITNFNIGNGYSFFKKGEQVSKLDWNNRSLSDLLPTYRYLLKQDNGNSLKAGTDVANSYYGGSCLKLYGNLAANQMTELTLYSMDLPVTDHTVFTTTAKSDIPTQLNAVVLLEDGSSKILTADCTTQTGWTTVTYDLSPLAGQKIRQLSYQISAAEAKDSYSLYLGNITITEDPAPALSTVSALSADEVEFDEDAMYAGVRLSWETDIPSAYYEIYRINENGSRSLLGVSNKTNFYINTLPRTDETNRSVFEVLPVTEALETGAGASVTVEWPDNSLPKAAFTADRTLIAPGEAVTFVSKCSENTKTLEWSFPGGNMESSGEASPSVTYSAAGTYPVTLKAGNDSGEAEAAVADYIIVTEFASDGLLLLSSKADVQASSYVNENEAPLYAVDGDKTKKWCATGTAPHELTIDLGSIKTVSAVDIFHAEAGGESPDMNSKAYSIAVSQDGSSYEQVISVTRNTSGTTHDTFAPAKARFVRLSIQKPTQGSDSAARIYEVEVYGLDE